MAAITGKGEVVRGLARDYDYVVDAMPAAVAARGLTMHLGQRLLAVITGSGHRCRTPALGYWKLAASVSRLCMS